MISTPQGHSTILLRMNGGLSGNRVSDAIKLSINVRETHARLLIDHGSKVRIESTLSLIHGGLSVDDRLLLVRIGSGRSRSGRSQSGRRRRGSDRSALARKGRDVNRKSSARESSDLVLPRVRTLLIAAASQAGDVVRVVGI
jgi:hypothetical protein